MAVSKETLDFLEQVKKGKPRKFVMLVKSMNVVSLVLYKKGAASKYVKEAKEEGTGAVFYGVVSGKGMDIRFLLATEDGFDKAPVKNLILKKYLEDIGFDCKPLFEIVSTQSAILDPDDALHARFMNLQPRALKACETNPAEAEKINALCLRVGRLFDEEDRDAAGAALNDLEKLLASLTAGTPQAPADAKHEQAYHALRAKLEPMLLAAQRSVPDKATAFSNVWNYSEKQADAGNFALANKALAGLAEALTKAKATPTAAADVLAIWLEAKEAADAQLNLFADELRKSGDQYLVGIAQGGVHSFIEGPSRVFVSLQASLMDFKSAEGPAREAARTKVLKAVTEYGKFLDASKFLEVCDTNELCGPLTIRSTLKESLARLEQALAA